MKENRDTKMMSERMKLEESLNSYSRALNEKSASIGTAALLVGGILLVGYIVGKKFLFRDKEKGSRSDSSDLSNYLMRTSPKHDSAIVRIIKEQMALFLIVVIKEKLKTYINSADNNKK